MKRICIYMAALALLAAGCTKQKNPCQLPDEELEYRLSCDFSHSREQVKSIISRWMPNVTDEQIDAWTESGKLESRIVNGERLYFNRTGRNIFRVDSLAKTYYDPTARANDLCLYDSMVVRVAMGERIEQRYRIHYRMIVDADVVPAGETIRCWMPYPRRDIPQHKDIVLIGTSPVEYTMSEPSATHSCLYMEKVAVEGEETIFEETFEYTCLSRHIGDGYAQHNPNDYLGEKIPHIVFTPRLRALSDSLSAGCTSDREKAEHFFAWISRNIPWAGAREYSTIPCIPEYVLDVMHGDCGQKTLLFVTLCRIAGIPAHFQSGFYLEPNDDGIHDWGEVYLDGQWVAVDQSYGLQNFQAQACADGRIPGDAETVRYCFLGNMEPWRLIINQDISAPLTPAKTHPRSETVDFQRGELEWKGGNLYFPHWDYEMEIEYL